MDIALIMNFWKTSLLLLSLIVPSSQSIRFSKIIWSSQMSIIFSSEHHSNQKLEWSTCRKKVSKWFATVLGACVNVVRILNDLVGGLKNSIKSWTIFWISNAKKWIIVLKYVSTCVYYDFHRPIGIRKGRIKNQILELQTDSSKNFSFKDSTGSNYTYASVILTR